MNAPIKQSLGYVALIVANTLVLFPIATAQENAPVWLQFGSLILAVVISLVCAVALRRIRLFQAIYLTVLVIGLAIVFVANAYGPSQMIIHGSIVLLFGFVGSKLLASSRE